MTKQAWRGTTGGTHGMQHALVSLIRHTDIRVAYAMMHLWLIWYILVRKLERNSSYAFHRRRGRSRLQATFDVYRSFYHFGKVVIDRFAVYGGYQFNIVVENKERYYDKMSSPQGLVLLFSHVGNSEMAAYSMATPDKRMHIIAFGGESPVVMAERAKVLARNNVDMIEVNPGDMSHIYAINEAIQHGDVLAVAGDRRMGDKSLPCTIMNATAPLPAGVFQLCVTLRCPVILPFVFKEKNNRYHIFTEELHINTSLPRADQAADLAQQFATRLEQMAIAHPYEWFNFFDFWNERHA